MGNTPRSMRASEISMTTYDSLTASAARSSSIPAMRKRSCYNPTDRSHPLKECRSCACSSISFSHLSRIISCMERRVRCSSKI
jgi:hypothetical protein